MSSGSCSTHPGRGKCCGNSRYAYPAGDPSGRTAKLRTPVVPASIAITTAIAAGKLAETSSSPRPALDRVTAMRVSMLTGGGDCPGLNAVMRAVVRKGEVVYGDELVGFCDGWRGAIEGQLMDLSVKSFRGTLPRGGTILGSSRTNPYKIDGGPERVKATLADHGIDALVAIGGEDTLGVASRLADEGVAVVGVPKTIDNDLSATELTFGFDTAVQVCVDAIDRLHTTAESHDRVMVVEVMGRHAGHIATWAAIAGGATAFDRVLATRFGIAAADAVHDGAFGQMVALRAGEIVRVPLADATAELKLVSEDLYDVARAFFG